MTENYPEIRQIQQNDEFKEIILEIQQVYNFD